MSSTKLIEHLEQTTASELTDNDLLMTSVWNGSKYISKKMTLGALADYVNGSNISEEGRINVMFGDNHDNTVDLYITDVTPSNANVSYSISSTYNPSEIQSWTSVTDNTVVVSFDEEADKQKKYVFFKVAKTEQFETIYMMHILQNYNTEITEENTILSERKSKTLVRISSTIPEIEFANYVRENPNDLYWYHPSNSEKWITGTEYLNHRFDGTYAWQYIANAYRDSESVYITFYYKKYTTVTQTSNTYLHSIISPLENIIL